MKLLRGVISDRLRRLFSPDDPAYSPERQSAEIADMDPNSYTGIALSRPGRHRLEDRIN